MLPTVKEPELDERRGLQEKTEEKHKLKKRKEWTNKCKPRQKIGEEPAGLHQSA